MSDGIVGVGYSSRLIEERLSDGRYAWFAYHPALPCCHAVGETASEASANLDQSREAWLTWAAAHDVDVAKPEENPSTSVQYALRVDAATVESTGGPESEQVPVAAMV